MTAKEARALMPSYKNSDKYILERIKNAAESGETRIWQPLSEIQCEIFKALGYSLEYLASENEYRISW